MKKILKSLLGLALVFLFISLSPSMASKPTAKEEVDALINEQKYSEALKKVQANIEELKSGKKDREWARLIVQEAMLKIGLHGYETSVKELRAREWPAEAVAHAMVSIAYSRSLQLYHQAYSWEIRKREKMSGQKEFNLKTLTSEEIYQEAYAGFEKAWKIRDELGSVKKDALPEIISPNNYPSEVRGTLRDTLSYLIAGFLADTSGWSPEDSGRTYTLDAGALLEKEAKFPISDPKFHPVQKIAYILRDLESWHSNKGERQAALEAKLELIRVLSTQLTSVSAKKKIQSTLESLAKKQMTNPWVSMVFATLGEILRSDGQEKIALGWATKGAQAFATSPGAARCRDLIHEIERPALSIEGMNIDGHGKQSVGLNYKNLKKVYFRSHKIDFRNFIRTTKDYSLRPGWRELEPFLKEVPTYKWDNSLLETTDYKQHVSYVTPPAHKPGLYAIMVSNEESFSSGVIMGIEMFVSDYVFQVSRNYEKQEFTVQVLSGAKGEPIKDAVVSLYSADYRNGHKLLTDEKTNTDGKARFIARSIINTSNSFFFVVEKDGQVIGSKGPDSMYAQGTDNSTTSESFIYTDRSIYRPEQKILWKIVAYRGSRSEKEFKVDAAQVVTVELLDANYEVVQKATVKTNKFGSASGEFLVPKGKLLGNWTMRSTHGGGTSIKIEEYKRPTFLVEFDEKGGDFRLNKDAVVKGKAKYYFGMPVTGGNARWTVKRQAILPWWCFWGRWNWGNVQNSEVIAAGSSPIKDDGSFEIKFRPVANEDVEDVKGINYNYQVKADVTDEGGETRSTELSNTIGFSAVTASFLMNENFFLAGKKAELIVTRTDLSGRPLAGKGTWKLVKLQLPKTTVPPSELPAPKELTNIKGDKLVFPDDLKKSRWSPDYRPEFAIREWKSGEEVTKGSLSHGENGKGNVSLPALKEGAYRLVYETKDSFNTPFEGQKDFLVVGDKTIFPLPGLFLLERSSVEVGEKARIFAASGFPSQRMMLETFKNGKSFAQKVLRMGKDATLIEIPVTESDRGGISFTLSLVNDYQDVRFTENLMVPWSNKLVDVEFSTFRDKIRPAGKETWAITLKGKNGRKIEPETFELLAYMYDKSLESFGPHQPPIPVGIFPSTTGANFADSELGAGTLIYTNHSYFPYQHEYTGFVSDSVIYYPRYGIGGPGRRSRGDGIGSGGMMMKAKGSAVMEDAAFSSMAEGAMDMASPSAAAPRELAKKASLSNESKQAEPAPAAVEMRTNFSETAFWKPHLVPGKNGTVTLEFTVPDSVTTWQVWAHAISRDLQSGSTVKETKTIKELLVRPYLPRFFREGDEAELRIVISNSSEKILEGKATFEILDDEGKKSLNKEFALSDEELSFSVKPGSSTNVSVKVKVPAGPKGITIKAIARSGNISDGEIRPIPVLPGRMHLAESKFVTLINKDSAELSFPGLKNPSDPTLINDLFVVTVDAQLFYSVLTSLPYLVNYPYQCTEQMMNSFVSSGIITSVFDQFPEVAKMAKDLSARKTRLESWNDNDPNRKLALEESPWLNLARGNDTNEDTELINVLHPDIAKNTRNKYLQLLQNSQTGSGGFPWFPGGPPSPWVTTYLLYGFSKAIEFKVDVPKPMIVKAWQYLHQHYVNEIVGELMAHDVGWEIVTFLNYVISNYPDASWTGNVFTESEKKTMLDFSMKHWKEHSPYLKSYLSLTLHRAKRTKDAVLVWESVMDSAKTSKDEGTHWAQEDRSWLWYNDTIETHALALRTGSELGTKRESLDGMVHWLFLNKKLNHWKSTRATSEVIYSLTQYLKKTKQLGIHEKVSVSMNGETTNFDFDPGKYTGKKNQIVVNGEKVSSKLVPVTVSKSTDGLAFASATWHYSTEKLPKDAVGDFFKVSRKYFKRVGEKSGMKLIPLGDDDKVEVGDEVEVQISLSSKHAAEYVHLRDPRAAGFEPVDPVSQHKYDLGIYWYEEIRDSGTNFFFESLPHGQYTFRYRIRAAIAGKFRAGPATIQPLYAPEFVGFSEGHEISIKQQK